MSLVNFDNKYTDKNSRHSYLPFYETLLHLFTFQMPILKNHKILLSNEYFDVDNQ